MWIGLIISFWIYLHIWALILNKILSVCDCSTNIFLRQSSGASCLDRNSLLLFGWICQSERSLCETLMLHPTLKPSPSLFYPSPVWQRQHPGYRDLKYNGKYVCIVLWLRWEAWFNNNLFRFYTMMCKNLKRMCHTAVSYIFSPLHFVGHNIIIHGTLSYVLDWSSLKMNFNSPSDLKTVVLSVWASFLPRITSPSSAYISACDQIWETILRRGSSFSLI